MLIEFIVKSIGAIALIGGLFLLSLAWKRRAASPPFEWASLLKANDLRESSWQQLTIEGLIGVALGASVIYLF